MSAGGAYGQGSSAGGGGGGGGGGLVDTHKCPICLEVMLHPTYSPLMLVPCGHTFCSRCLGQYMKAGAPICPLCRAPVDASAPNHTLRAMIVGQEEAGGAGAGGGGQGSGVGGDRVLTPQLEERIRESNANPTHVEQIREYLSMYSLAEARGRVLQAERAAAAEELAKHEKEKAVSGQVIEYLATEENGVIAHMQRLAKELEVVRAQLREKTEVLRLQEASHSAAAGRVADLDTSLAAIAQETVKARAFLSHLAPNLNLDE